MRLYTSHNGFIPNYQTFTENTAGNFDLFDHPPHDAANPAYPTSKNQAESRDDWSQQAKHLNMLSSGKILIGLENFLYIENRRTGHFRSY